MSPNAAGNSRKTRLGAIFGLSNAEVGLTFTRPTSGEVNGWSSRCSHAFLCHFCCQRKEKQGNGTEAVGGSDKTRLERDTCLISCLRPPQNHRGKRDSEREGDFQVGERGRHLAQMEGPSWQGHGYFIHYIGREDRWGHMPLGGGLAMFNLINFYFLGTQAVWFWRNSSFKTSWWIILIWFSFIKAYCKVLCDLAII